MLEVRLIIVLTCILSFAEAASYCCCKTCCCIFSIAMFCWKLFASDSD